MKVFIVPCADKAKSIAALPSVINILKSTGVQPILPESAAGYSKDYRAKYMDADTALRECDILMTIGGDGMILEWGKRAAAAGKPVIGINTGRVGFMTAIDADEPEKLKALAEGTYTLSRRMMLSAQFTHGGTTKEIRALNDVVLFKEAGSKLPEFEVKINGTTVTKVRADGIILSTPTGSTAYALAAGGPIIEPTVECIQLTTLCAHTLLNRPMIFSSSDTVTVNIIPYEGSRVYLSADGENGTEYSPDDRLVIRKSEVFLELAEMGEKSFYNTVGEKLMTPLK